MICQNDYKVKFNPTFELESDEIYIAGGVYGNPFALQKLSEISNGAKVVLNGDLHWFDATKESFLKTEYLAQEFICLNGNVELELAKNSLETCGCNYPEYEDKDVIARADEIFKTLNLAPSSEQREMLKKRKTTLFAKVGNVNIAITHGDEKNVAGWELDRVNLEKQTRQNELNQWFLKTTFSVLASTHTCQAGLLKLKNGIVINNGSAGMPNFSEFRTGLVTRIATTPHQNAFYRSSINEVFIELIRLKYDNAKFLKYFDEIWSEQSPAALSYKTRILGYGCPLSYKQLSFGGFELIE
ncbi:hypothetical protein [Campylobacter geochelonis]|uniref:hypothetical protein n=1 Tax=Campylobacter geochelonis TaxID=1780362 RepID=UPI0007707C34|nr:hypothetical protein [Campylobacter geochelonis]CZE46690.1 Uncharacterised protein [Campylobacter geochelonis]